MLPPSRLHGVDMGFRLSLSLTIRISSNCLFIAQLNLPLISPSRNFSGLLLPVPSWFSSANTINYALYIKAPKEHQPVGL